MSKGFTLIELVLTVIVLSILSAFTFSVIWQYSQLYGDTRKGSVYSEAAAVLERMSRELKDAANVDPTAFGSPLPVNGSTSTYISLQSQNGTPADKAPPLSLTPPYWVQYCIYVNALYRVPSAAVLTTNACAAGPPAAAGTARMSSNIRRFQVKYFAGRLPPDPLNPDGDSYEITLQAASGASASNPSITLVTRVAPRNYPFPAGLGRSYQGAYYDEIN